MAFSRAILFILPFVLAQAAEASLTLADSLTLSGGARAYYSSRYASSTGTWVYDAPVIENYLDLTLDSGPFGWIRTDAWIFSDISGTCQDIHRRAFSCYEGTLVYGYDLPLDAAREIRLSSAGGILWDWLGGYQVKHGTPIFYYAYQSLENPLITPYWNFLGGPITEGDVWNRMKLGLRRGFHPFDRLTLTPSAETTWGDRTRFLKNYGEKPSRRIVGGSLMFCLLGLTAQWQLDGNWHLWARYRHWFALDSQARQLIRDRHRGPHSTEFPIGSIGIGYRF